MYNVKPKKALGQHFLTDKDVARRIASTLDAWHGLPVLEVGPGMGVLTRYLLEKGHDVTVAEIDGESVAYLKDYMPELKPEITMQESQSVPTLRKACTPYSTPALRILLLHIMTTKRRMP